MRQTNQIFLLFLAMTLMPTRVVVYAQGDRYSSKTLFAARKASIVEVFAGGQAKGSGFVISDKGLILTANHVVTSPDFKAYLTGITVKLSDGSVIDAAPALDSPSAESIDHDYAILRTHDLKGPILKLGTWQEVTEGDQLTTIGYPLTPPNPLVLSVMAAGRFPINNTNAVVFEGPTNRGLSGAPLISNKTGDVVGIVTSRLVGITLGLQNMRATIQGNSGQGHVEIYGVNPNAAILELTNVLDDYLISGMGAAIAIDYAKAAETSVLAQSAARR